MKCVCETREVGALAAIVKTKEIQLRPTSDRKRFVTKFLFEFRARIELQWLKLTNIRLYLYFSLFNKILWEP